MRRVTRLLTALELAAGLGLASVAAASRPYHDGPIIQRALLVAVDLTGAVTFSIPPSGHGAASVEANGGSNRAQT
jgi:hypothetical protein